MTLNDFLYLTQPKSDLQRIPEFSSHYRTFFEEINFVLLYLTLALFLVLSIFYTWNICTYGI